MNNDRTRIVQQIDALNDQYCSNCPIKQQLYADSKTKAHRFCIHVCSIGKSLQAYGDQLLYDLEQGK